jgi:endo-1,4-beta-xylanase
MTWSRRHFLQRAGLSAAALPWLSQASTGPMPSPCAFWNSLARRDALAQARANIPKLRQRNATLTLLGREGRPLANHEVEIEQLSHQFQFGDNNWSMATYCRRGEAYADRLHYLRERFKGVLNALNTTVYWTERPRNDGTKTMDFQGDLRLDDFDESVNWALANGLVAKGHPLFWMVPKAIPDWAKTYDPETLMKFVEVRVRNLVARYRGRVSVWDAVNEMLWETAPANLSQRVWPYTETLENLTGYIGKVLRWAREEDPEAKLAINDYGISGNKRSGLTDQRGNPVSAASQRQRYVELVQRLGDVGTAPDLLGLQGRPAWVFPEDQVAVYDELAEAGVPLTVTEFWPGLDYLLQQANREAIESEEWRSIEERNVEKAYSPEEAEALRDEFALNYLTVAFGHPAVDSFYFWGFMGAAVNFAPGTTSSHELAPIYEKMRQLIWEEWRTSLKLVTDDEGKLRFRGFCGGYSARLNPATGGPAYGHRFSLDKAQPEHRFVIPTVLKA